MAIVGVLFVTSVALVEYVFFSNVLIEEYTIREASSTGIDRRQFHNIEKNGCIKKTRTKTDAVEKRFGEKLQNQVSTRVLFISSYPSVSAPFFAT